MIRLDTPLVLLHGWGFTPPIWQPVVDALIEQGIDRHKIHMPSLPLINGGGLEETLVALSQQLPQHAHIAGWSLGGEIALGFAHRFPEKVASITLISSTPSFLIRDDWAAGQPEALQDDFEHRLSDNPTALLKRFGTLIRHGDTDASRNRALGECLLKLSEQDTLRLASGLALLRTIDLRQICTTIETPLSLIHGVHDAVVPFAAAQWLQKQCGANLYRIDNGSHALPFTHARFIAKQLATLMEH